MGPVTGHGTQLIYAVPTYLGVLNLVGSWRPSAVGISKTDFKPQEPMIHTNICIYIYLYICRIRSLCFVHISVYWPIFLFIFPWHPINPSLNIRSLNVSVSVFVSACLPLFRFCPSAAIYWSGYVFTGRSVPLMALGWQAPVPKTFPPPLTQVLEAAHFTAECSYFFV